MSWNQFPRMTLFSTVLSVPLNAVSWRKQPAPHHQPRCFSTKQGWKGALHVEYTFSRRVICRFSLLSGPLTSKSLFNWRTVGRSVRLDVELPVGPITIFCICRFRPLRLYPSWGAMSDVRTGLSFTIRLLGNCHCIIYTASQTDTVYWVPFIKFTLCARFPVSPGFGKQMPYLTNCML